MSARNVVRVLCDNLIQSAVFFDKLFQIYLFERGENFFVRNVFFRHPEIISYAFVENISIVTYRRKVRIPILARQLFKLFAADSNVTILRTERADKHIDNRGFSAPAFADYCRHSLFGEGHIHVFQNVAFIIVRERDVFELDLLAVHVFSSPFGIGRVKKRNNLFTRACAVHSNVECRSERAKGQEKFNRHKAQEQCRNRVQSPKRRAADCKRDTDSRAAVCNQVHYRGTCKLHYENFHRDDSEFFRAFVYFNVLSRVCLKNFEFFKSLNAVEELIAHRSVFAPIFRKNLLCVLTYRYNRYRDKRNAGDKNESRSPIDPHAYQEQYYGRDHRKKELRKIRRIIKVELLYAFDRNLRESCHAHSVGSLHTEFHYFVIHPFAQIFFYFSSELVLYVARRA